MRRSSLGDAGVVAGASAAAVAVLKVSTEDIGFLVESESTCTKEAMHNVVKEVSRLEREREREELRALEAEGLRGTARPRQKYHFTLIRYV